MAPVLTPSTCANGEVTASVLTPQGPPEVAYSFDPGRHGRCGWGGVVRAVGDVGDGDGDVDVAERQRVGAVERWLAAGRR